MWSACAGSCEHVLVCVCVCLRNGMLCVCVQYFALCAMEWCGVNTCLRGLRFMPSACDVARSVCVRAVRRALCPPVLWCVVACAPAASLLHFVLSSDVLFLLDAIPVLRRVLLGGNVGNPPSTVHSSLS